MSPYTSGLGTGMRSKSITGEQRPVGVAWDVRLLLQLHDGQVVEKSHACAALP